MRILVTGQPRLHRVGRSRRCSPTAGTTSSGSTPFFYRGCDFGPEVGQVAGRFARRPRRRARRPGRLRRDRPPGRALERSARRPRPGADRARSTATRRCGLPAQRARRASAGSSSPPRARCTAPPETDDALDEEAPLQPLTAYAESKVRAEEGLVRARGPGVRSRLDAQRDRLRRLAAPAARHRAQQPRGLGHTTGRIRLAQRRHRRGGRSCTCATSRKRHWRCSTRPRSRYAAASAWVEGRSPAALAGDWIVRSRKCLKWQAHRTSVMRRVSDDGR